MAVGNKLGLVSEETISNYLIKKMEKRFDTRILDLPAEFDFHFRDVDVGDKEGFKVFVECTPTLFLKKRKNSLDPDKEYDTKLPVDRAKKDIKHIFAKVRADSLREPYTELEIHNTGLEEFHRETLQETQYGVEALKYLDEGEECLRRCLIRAALNCYVLAIEWTIIAYYDMEMDRDLIDEGTNQEGRGGYSYRKLVSEMLGQCDRASQKTKSALLNMNYDKRRWAAHPKSGNLVKSDVLNVRDRLEILIQELFPR